MDKREELCAMIQELHDNDVVNITKYLMNLMDVLDGDDTKQCTYYEYNDKKPCCAHKCFGCEWFK